jgi:hypothetical protein
MRPTTPAILLALTLLFACNRKDDHTPAASAGQPANTVVPTPPPQGSPDQERPPQGAPDQGRPPQASLPEPKGPIDPKSVEAAGQVVQHYGALVEQDDFLKAERLWGDLDAARSFAVAVDARFKDVHLEIGELGATEGAAGSIYTTVPVTFYGTSERGKPLRMPAEVILRRVNDVPGSTERQRRWHIERIDWKAGG